MSWFCLIYTWKLEEPQTAVSPWLGFISVDTETASHMHPTSTVSTPHWWAPNKVKQLSVALPSLPDDWGHGHWLPLNRPRALYPPPPAHTTNWDTWCSWWVWRNIQWLLFNLLPLQLRTASKCPPICIHDRFFFFSILYKIQCTAVCTDAISYYWHVLVYKSTQNVTACSSI